MRPPLLIEPLRSGLSECNTLSRQGKGNSFPVQGIIRATVTPFGGLLDPLLRVLTSLLEEVGGGTEGSRRLC